jgi:hypothetical protein
MSKYGKLPELLEEIEYRFGKKAVKDALFPIWLELRKKADEWIDSMKDEADIDKCFEFRAIVDEGERRFHGGRLSSTGCVWIISAWEKLDVEDPVGKMCRHLISLEKEPISALALVGEYLA